MQQIKELEKLIVDYGADCVTHALQMAHKGRVASYQYAKGRIDKHRRIKELLAQIQQISEVYGE
jgi:hypothetical protein